MCLFPKLIHNPKYKANKKNGGNIPAVSDYRVLKVPIGCGNCIECRKQKSRNWRIRLYEEIKNDRSGQFVTFTYSNESLLELSKEFPKISGYTLDNAIATLSVRRFLERWRKKFGRSVKHWFITELGHTNTERLHIHGILFTNEKSDLIESIWKYGNVKCRDYVNSDTVEYLVKYLHKSDPKHKYYKSIVLTSAGIGKNYTNSHNAKLNKFNGINTVETYKTNKGLNIALPIYYRNKLFDENERESLWLNKLDKNERYVLGRKIDLNSPNGELLYWKALKEAQQLNRELGFGSDEIDWDVKRYENELRSIKMKENAKAFKIKQSIKNSASNK